MSSQGSVDRQIIMIFKVIILILKVIIILTDTIIMIFMMTEKRDRISVPSPRAAWRVACV